MAIVTIPAGLYMSALTIRQRVFNVQEVSEVTGSVAERIGVARWIAGIKSPDRMTESQAALWTAMAIQLRGRINHLALYDVVRPVPVGTMRGSLTLNGTHAGGSATLSITGGAGQAGTTLKAQDWLQIGAGVGSHFCMVTADATANGSGVISVNIEPPLRAQITSGVVVAWNQPLCHMKRSDAGDVGWNYERGNLGRGGVVLDLIEQW